MTTEGKCVSGEQTNRGKEAVDRIACDCYPCCYESDLDLFVAKL